MIQTGKILDLILIIITCASTWYFMWMATKGKKVPSLRHSPVIDAIYDGIDRALEMGKPVHFCPGAAAELRGVLAPMTITAMNVLKEVAKQCASKGVRLIVHGAQSPEVIPLIKGVMQEAYVEVGKSEMFNQDDIRYYGQESRILMMGIVGSFAREGVACNILFGAARSDAVTTLEAGRVYGGINIGGTARWLMMYAFAMMGDYICIGDEIYAVGTAISKDPVAVASLIGGDVLKWIFLGLTCIGIILTATGLPVQSWLSL